MSDAAPTILAFETDSAWIVILYVSLITLTSAAIARRMIRRPGGLASGILLMLPLVVPVLAAVIYESAVLPEVGVLQPASRGVLGRSGLLHLLLMSNEQNGVVTPYALRGSAGPWLLLTGALVSAFMLLRRLAGGLLLRSLVRRCSPVTGTPAEYLEPMVTRLTRAAALKTPVELLLLPPAYSGAFAVGAKRPKILLSADLLDALEPDELEAIIAHELSHIEARDVQVVFASGLLRDFVAWNPVAHIAFRALVRDREHEADRRAAEMTGRPLAVASGLVKMYEVMRHRRTYAQRSALAFLRPGGSLTRRVVRLLALADGPGPELRNTRLPFVAAACLIAALGLQAGASISAPDSGGFAIVVGAPSPASRGLWRPSRVLAPPVKARPQERVARPPRHQVYKRALTKAWTTVAGLPVKEDDLAKWEREMTKLAAQQGVAIKVRWEGRQDWEAEPLFSTPAGGSVGIYTIHRAL